MKKILYIASEAMPFASTGGLADVMGSLPIEVAKEGVDVRVVMPLYSSIADKYREMMTTEAEFYVPLSWRKQYCGVKSLMWKGVKFYFIDNEYYFARDKIYANYDDGERFAFFSLAAIDMLGVIGYNGVVNAIDLYDEEEESKKVILIHSKQKTQLRLDENFLSADKYQAGVMASGAIGRIAGADVVISNKVKLVDGVYYNPIIKLNNDNETEDDLPAITYFLKRGNLVEHKREEGVADNIICTAHGMAALTNEAKVVIAKFAAAETV